ncbi:MAG: hypothetical protein LBE25_03605 [Arthrobacter sp.]|nr:hypothetical protein [Arthrobacter sp.]
MTRSSGLSTSPGARIARGCGVLLVGALWIGVTSTTAADGASARPGDAASPVQAPASLAIDDPARALPRLVESTALLTGPAGQALHEGLAQAAAWLAPQTPAGDAQADALALQEAGPVTEQNNVARTVAAAKESFALAGSLATAAGQAPAGQAQRLLRAAALLDDEARDTLKAAGRDVPGSGGVARALGAPSGAAAEATALASLADTLSPAFAGSLCTGENATTITEATPSASAGPTPSGTTAPSTPEPVSGFPLFGAESVALTSDAADLLHSAGAAAGRLAYASEVVAARAKTDSSSALADSRGELARALQSAQPAGCLPVVVTSAGPAEAFTGEGASATMMQARAALADRLLDAGVAVSGDARSALLRQWWQNRPAA